MKNIIFWIFPAIVVTILLGVLAADVVDHVLRPEAEISLIPVTGYFDFIPRFPVFTLSDQKTTGVGPHLEPWNGITFEEGWSHPEAHGRWAVGLRSRLTVHLADAGKRTLLVECRTFPELEHGRRQKMEVFVNGHNCGRVDIGRRNQRHAFDLSEDMLHVGSNEFVFEYAHHRPPPTNVRRRLAVHFRSISLIEAGKKPAKNHSPTVVNEKRGTITMATEGRLILPFSAPTATTAISFGFAFVERKNHTGKAGRLRARLVTLDHDRVTTLYEQEAIKSMRPRGRLRLRAGNASGPMALIVDFQGDPSGETALEIRSPDMLALPPAAGDQRHEPKIWFRERFTRQKTTTARPDIVFIILDATRHDHVGTMAGYNRNTTPNLDRTANTSLVFTNVRSQASYTHCSVPTMLTGLSFASHGVIWGDHRLPDAEETLAERLSAAGYYTVGFSAAPYNGRYFGTAQGYDEFQELWTKGDFTTVKKADFLARQVVKRLEKGFDTRPLFMMMHIIPPHEPYTPAPRFDLWGDPDYDGPCDGSDAYFSLENKGRFVPTDADIAEMKALYDGNLREADAAVGDILRAVATYGRPRETLLVITSDHGEAFYEHGRRAHGTTVYEEMSRVPLLIRLPGGELPDDIDLGRAAGLEDLVPTILGVLGLPAGDRVRGIDLLARNDRPSRAPRILLTRSIEQLGVTSIVRGRWKAMFDAKTSGRQLYDLENDPGETTNLAADRPALLAMLGHLLKTELESAPPPFDRHDTQGLPEKEREMLRHLGYAE